MTTYMFLKILVRLHQFEPLNLFKILQINNIFSYIHRFETDFEELSYTLILILYFSVFYSFWYNYRHYSFFDKMMERIDEVHKLTKVASAINPCSLNISINVVYEAQRKVTVSKGTLHPKFIISFLMHGIFKFVQIMTVGFHYKKIIELRKLVYRIFDLVMLLVMCGSDIGVWWILRFIEFVYAITPRSETVLIIPGR